MAMQLWLPQQAQLQLVTQMRPHLAATMAQLTPRETVLKLPKG